MFDRIKTKISGARHQERKHEKHKHESSLSAEDCASENPKVSPLEPGVSSMEIQSGGQSGQTNIVQPSFDGALQEGIGNLTWATHESHLRNERSPDAKGAGTAEDRLRTASQALNRVIEEYLKGNPDATVIEQLQKVHGAISSALTLDTADFTCTLRGALSKLSENMTGRKKRWATSVGNFLSKLYPLTTLTLGLAATGAEAGAFIPLKCAANGVTLLLQIATEEHGRGEDFMKQLDRIAFQSNRIAEIQMLPQIVVGDILLEKSMDLMTAILDFFRLSLMYFKHDYFYNLGKTLLLGPNIYFDAKADLVTAIAEYDQALLLQITTSVLSGKASVEIRHEHANSEAFQAWLQPSLFETESQFTKGVQFRAPGTLQWLLDLPKFRDWRLSCEKAKFVLWFSGLPGVGKTIISAYIVEILRTQYPGALVLYFFVKAGEKGISTVSNIIRTYAGQLAEIEPEAQRHMDRLRSKGLNLSGDLLPAQLIKELLHDPLKYVTKPVFMIIDGLDECASLSTSGSETELGAFISSLLTLNCRLFIASRPTSTITRWLERWPTKFLGFEDSCYDIELYVKANIQDNPVLQDGFTKLKIDPVEFILGRSKGNFLWVSIVLDLLIKNRTSSMKAFQTVIDSLPPLRGCSGDQSGNLSCAIVILEWILYSKSSLNLEDLKNAVEICLEDEILDLSRLIEGEFGEFLIIVSHATNSQTVQVGHETFRTYITQEAQPKFLIRESSANARIARACLEIMCAPGKGSSWLQGYAIKNWMSHFTTCTFTESLEHGIDKALERFLNSNGLRYWLTRAPATNGKWSAFEFSKQAIDLYRFIIAWSEPLNMDGITWSDSILGDPLGGSDLATHLSATFASVWLDTLWDTYDIAEWVCISSLRLWISLRKSEISYTHERYKSPDQLKEHLRLGGFNPRKQYHPFNAAIPYIESGFEGAEELLWKAYDEDPENFLYLEAFGRLYRWGKYQNMEKCLEYFERAMKLDPHPVAGCGEEYWSILADERSKKGDFEGACRAFWDALERPVANNGEVFWNRLAGLYKDNKDYVGAKQVYLAALRKHPEDGWKYWRDVGHCDEKLGDWKAELVTYLEAIHADPEYQNNYLSSIERIPDRQKRKQHYNEACEILISILDHTDLKVNQFKKQLADIYLEWGKWKEALVLLEELVPGAEPDERQALWHEVGDAHIALGGFDKAISAYKQDTREGASGAGAAAWLGRAHALLQQHDIAIREFKRAIRLSKADELAGPQWGFSSYSKQRQAILWLAETYEAVGRTKDAKEQYLLAKEVYLDCREAEKALVQGAGGDRIWRSEGRTHVILAQILESLSEIDAAREELAIAIKIFDVTTYIEDDEFEKSEHEDALKELERISQDPVPPRASLTEQEAIFRRQRDLIFTRRSNLAVHGWDSKPPRYRI